MDCISKANAKVIQRIRSDEAAAVEAAAAAAAAEAADAEKAEANKKGAKGKAAAVSSSADNCKGKAAAVKDKEKDPPQPQDRGKTRDPSGAIEAEVPVAAGRGVGVGVGVAAAAVALSTPASSQSSPSAQPPAGVGAGAGAAVSPDLRMQLQLLVTGFHLTDGGHRTLLLEGRDDPLGAFADLTALLAGLAETGHERHVHCLFNREVRFTEALYVCLFDTEINQIKHVRLRCRLSSIVESASKHGGIYLRKNGAAEVYRAVCKLHEVRPRSLHLCDLTDR